MNATGEDLVMRACRLQLEAAVGMIEAITEGSKKLGEAQLKAATEACAGAQAMHKKIAAAADAQELWRLQNEWTSDNIGKALAYWRELYEIGLAAQSSIARRLSEQVELAGPRAPAIGAGSPGALLEMMDTAYKQWLETTRQFYASPIVSAPQVRQPA